MFFMPTKGTYLGTGVTFHSSSAWRERALIFKFLFMVSR